MPPRSPLLPWQRVTEDLRQRLEAGEWAPEEALPSVAKLAGSYGVSRTVVARAIRHLESEGLVRVVPRWGVFRS
jgi:DNA-binding GntR family transcriptional regulator